MRYMFQKIRNEILRAMYKPEEVRILDPRHDIHAHLGLDHESLANEAARGIMKLLKGRTKTK